MPSITSIVIRDASGRMRVRISTDDCAWCTDTNICAACHAKADMVRASIARTDTSRAAAESR